MNHFLLASRHYAKNESLCHTEAGKYGIHSMELLINGMMKLGARRENLKAKAFGGASMIVDRTRRDNFVCVGEVNSRFIVEFLKTDGIPLSPPTLAETSAGSSTSSLTISRCTSGGWEKSGRKRSSKRRKAFGNARLKRTKMFRSRKYGSITWSRDMWTRKHRDALYSFWRCP